MFKYSDLCRKIPLMGFAITFIMGLIFTISYAVRKNNSSLNDLKILFIIAGSTIGYIIIFFIIKKIIENKKKKIYFSSTSPVEFIRNINVKNSSEYIKIDDFDSINTEDDIIIFENTRKNKTYDNVSIKSDDTLFSISAF